MPAKLPPVLSIPLLRSLRSQPNLPPHTWYFLAGITLSALNRPHEIPSVLRFALEHGATNAPTSRPTSSNTSSTSSDTSSGLSGTLAEQQRMCRRLREALVKSSAVLGLPKTINALLALKPATPAHLLDLPGDDAQHDPEASTPDTPISTRVADLHPQRQTQGGGGGGRNAVLDRGAALFARVYGKVAGRVMGQMDRCGTPDLGLVARVEYGYILSGGLRSMDSSSASASAPASPVPAPGELQDPALWTDLDTSWVLLAGLIPQDVNPQLKGHLKGALNNGATVAQVRAVRDVCMAVCEAAGMRRLWEEAGEGQVEAGWGWTEEPETLKEKDDVQGGELGKSKAKL